MYQTHFSTLMYILLDVLVSEESRRLINNVVSVNTKFITEVLRPTIKE